MTSSLLEEKYFVGSEDDKPKRLYFYKPDAFLSWNRFIDSFDQNGKPVKSYMRVGNSYTEEF